MDGVFPAGKAFSGGHGNHCSLLHSEHYQLVALMPGIGSIDPLFALCKFTDTKVFVLLLTSSVYYWGPWLEACFRFQERVEVWVFSINQ